MTICVDTLALAVDIKPVIPWQYHHIFNEVMLIATTGTVDLKNLYPSFRVYRAVHELHLYGFPHKLSEREAQALIWNFCFAPLDKSWLFYHSQRDYSKDTPEDQSILAEWIRDWPAFGIL